MSINILIIDKIKLFIITLVIELTSYMYLVEFVPF